MKTEAVLEIFSKAFFEVHKQSDDHFRIVEGGGNFVVRVAEGSYIQFFALFQTEMDTGKVMFAANHINSSLLHIRAYHAEDALHLDHTLNVTDDLTSKQIVTGFRAFASAVGRAITLLEEVEGRTG